MIRLATYNVEWFDSLFDDDGTPLLTSEWSSRRDVTRVAQLEALAHVFRAMDADAVLIVEAPDANLRRSGTRALESFAAQFGLRTRRAVMGFANDTQQEIALLYDPDQLSAAHDPGETPGAPRFDEAFEIDLDVDAQHDRVVFSKPPLELAMRTARGAALRLIGAHLKSKAPHGAVGRDAIMRAAIANRRKQLAQAIWLRRRIDSVLAGGESLVVMGDLNDGPGLDEYEHLFGRSSVEVVLGADLFDPHARDALERRIGGSATTSRFFLKDKQRFLQALLDYAMVSEDLRARGASWRIWHPFDDPECWRDDQLRTALLTASDHFPVTLDLDL